MRRGSCEQLPRNNLFSKIQISEYRAVSLNVTFLKIIEQPTALPYQAQQPESGGVVFFVLLKMLREVG